MRVMALEAVQTKDLTCARLELRLLRIPLRVPYKLAFGPVEAFDTLLVEISAGGSKGFGEATFLPGYSDETAKAGWARALDLAGRMVGHPLQGAATLATSTRGNAAFTATAFVTACEMASGHGLLTVARRTAVPLLAIVNSVEPAAYEAEIEAHLAAGYRTLKVKVGFELEADMARVRRIQRFAGGRAQLRLDGNQGYRQDDALRFVRALDPEGIELLEQPCAAGDWDSAAAVARASPVPMMLDESIFGIADIERASDLEAARYIKLKLMKAGGLGQLVAGLRRIRELGMVPVLGNGVAADVGCWMEACVAAHEIENAGEMNGFLKPTAGLFRSPVAVENGAMILEPGGMPALDRETLDRLTVRREVFADS
jgi:L-alanine-DL-glutamate epimerase-like enolase superfamily enzyme